ncbi:hypothetical protein AMTR_s00067p00165850 [Amborella trichopoda]|uniref:Uncharacterized protein n=1 Tax=Amborella trichopoda TaxID=13333 RepID=U5DBU4_AMBTC|nr:hypothetical protein AMTR_s00067p00165850 [Amborella trichopoda]
MGRDEALEVMANLYERLERCTSFRSDIISTSASLLTVETSMGILFGMTFRVAMQIVTSFSECWSLVEDMLLVNEEQYLMMMQVRRGEQCCQAVGPAVQKAVNDRLKQAGTYPLSCSRIAVKG